MKLADSSRAIIISLVLFLTLQSAFAAENASIDNSTQSSPFGISSDSGKYSLGQMVSISLTYFQGAEISISNGEAVYRYLSPSSLVVFRPPTTGNYTAVLYNSSEPLANTTFSVLEPETLLWADRSAYYVGDEVQIFLYPNTTTYLLVIEHNNESYQFIDQQTYPAIFYPREAGNYSVTATFAGKTIATSFFAIGKLPSKVEVNYTYAGSQINFSLQNITPPYSVMVSAPGRSYNFIDVTGAFQFLPEEPGNYTFRFLKDSALVAELPVEISGQILTLDKFPLQQDILLQINFSEFAAQQESFFDRLLGVSPISQISAYVEGYKEDTRFRMALSSAGEYTFNLQLFSNPAIEQGTYTIVVEVRSGKESTTKKYSFIWQTSRKEPSAYDYVNYSFQQGQDIVIPVNFTDEITTPSSFLDWLLRRSRIDTLVLYVDGQEENAAFAPQAEHTGLDNFVVRIKSSAEIRQDVYALVAIAKVDGKQYRKTFVFNYGLAAKEIPAKAKNLGVIEVVDQNGEPITFSRKQQTTGKRSIALSFSDQPLTEITISDVSFEEGLISIAASITPPMHVEVKKAYAISPSFSILGTITAVAEGTELYRCDDYTPAGCSWRFARNITPGQPYTEEITGATAFAEALTEKQQPAAQPEIAPLEVQQAAYDKGTKPFKMEVVKPSKQRINSDIRITKTKKETQNDITVDMELKLETDKIGKIELSDVTIARNSDINITFDDVPGQKAEFKGKNFVKVYAIDASSLNFTAGKISAVAKGSKLVKCEEWDMTYQTCYGTWKEVLNLTPGKEYTIDFNSSDPAWAEIGLVAINTHKSTYLPGEMAKISVSVLDKFGNTVCDADIRLEIISPSGAKTILATEDRSIIRSDQCFLNVATEPDYSANYTASEIGSYLMNLTAITYDGEPYTISNFSAAQSVSFDIERIGATRIYPFVPYNFSFAIGVNEDYSGNITEVVPAGFAITNTDAQIIPNNDETQLVVWQVSLSAGSQYVFSYTFKAPEISPFLYELGPLQIGTFQESRKWQIASDTKTLDSEAMDAPTTQQNLVIGGTFTMTCNPACSGSGGFPSVTHTYQWCTDSVCTTASSISTNPATTETLSLTNNPETADCNVVVSETVTARNTGSVYIRCRAVEGSRSANSGTILVVVTETVPPNNTIIFPAANVNISGSFLVNASINDSTGVNRVNMTLFNNTGNATGLIMMSLGAGNSQTGWWNVTFDSTTVRDGRYNISVNATDTSGNVNISRNVSITIDNTMPNASIVVPVNNNNLSANFLINASVNDSLSQVFNATFRLTTSSGSTITSWLFATRIGTIAVGWWNTTVSIASLPSGVYNITVNATDFAGNQRIANISQVAIDTQAPNISLETPINTTNVSTSFLINASVNDTASQVRNVTFRLMNSTWAGSWMNARVGAGTIGIGWWNITASITGLANGLYNVTANATDFSGNQVVANLSMVLIDTVKANVSIVEPVNGTIVSQTININSSVNDTGSLVSSVAYRLIKPGQISSWASASLTSGSITTGYWSADFNTLSLPDGMYNITINATDFAGNQQLLNISYVIVQNVADMVPPNASIISPRAGFNISGSFVVNASVNDTNGSIAGAYLAILNSTGNVTAWIAMSLLSGNTINGFWNASFDSTALADGYYNLSVNASDMGGNYNLSGNVTVVVDNTRANVSMVVPANGTTFSGVTFLINASVNDSLAKVSSVKFRLTNSDGTSASSWLTASLKVGTISAGYWNASFASGNLISGTYNITINATDFAGNQQVINISQIIISNPLPNVTITLPRAGANISGSFTTTASVNSSINNVNNVNLSLLQPGSRVYGPVAMSLSSGTQMSGIRTVTFNSNVVADGIYNLSVNATDSVGHTNISANVSVFIDNTAPNISMMTPANDSYVSGYMLVNISSNDSVTKVFNITFRLTNYNGSSMTSWTYTTISAGDINIGFWNATIDTTALRNGKYNITVNATDFSGNQRVINISQITIENVQIAAGESAYTLLMAQACGREEGATSQAFSLACAGTYPAACPTDRLSCSDGTSEASSIGNNQFGGVNITSYNSTVLNCAEVVSVRVCYNWTSGTSSHSSCQIGVDSAGDLTWSATTVTCPSTTPSGVICIDVSSSETWACNDFFGITSPSAWAYIEAKKTSGGSATLYIDALYFNVSYTLALNPPHPAIIVPVANANLSADFLINASVNDSVSAVVSVNATIYNSTGNVTGVIPMNLTTGTANFGYWNATASVAQLVDGRYNISIVAANRAGNLNISRNVSIILDRTKANVSAVVPFNGTTFSGQQILINASVNDSLSKVASVKFMLITASGTSPTGWVTASLGAGNIGQGYWNATVDGTTLQNGNYNITINATDFSGNHQVINISRIVIGNAAPNNTIIRPFANANISGSFLVNASVNHTGVLQFVNVTLWNSTGNVTGLIRMSLGAGTTSSGYWNATINTVTLGLVDGFYNISVNATDSVGNTNISANVTIIIDNTGANISAVVPTNGTVMRNQNFVVNDSVNDSLTGVLNVSFRITNAPGTVITPWQYAAMSSGSILVGYWSSIFDSTDFINGRYNITVNATDFAGNQKIVNISYVDIDNDLVNNSIAVPLPGYNFSGSLFVNASINKTMGITNRVNVTLFNNTGRAYGPYAMSIGAGDATNGYWNATLNIISLGIRDAFYNVSVNATDEAGNVNISENVSIIIDRTSANVSAVAPINLTNIQGIFLINASVNDSLSKVFNATFRLASPGSATAWIYASMGTGTISAGYWNASFDITTLAQGRYNVTINATDFSGNQQLVNISEIIYDTVKPNNTVILPPPNSNISGTFTVRASINDSASGAANVNLTIFNSTGNATGMVPMSLQSGNKFSGFWTVNFDSTSLRDDYYNVSVNATDLGGNTNISANISIVIDNTKANVTAVIPANDTVFEEQTILINASVNDSLSKVFNVTFRLTNSGGSSVTAWLYAERNSGTISQGYWNASISGNDLVNGVYNITANATDFSGNQILVNISQIQVSNVAPNNTIVVPLPGYNFSGSFVVNASINDSGTVASAKVTLFNNTGLAYGPYSMSLTSGTTNTGYWSITINTVSLSIRDGYYNISVNATDVSRNSNISLNVSATIDNTRANVSMVVPVNRTNQLTSFLINASVNDSLSKVFNVTFRLTNSAGTSTSQWIYATMSSGNYDQGYWNATFDITTLAQGRYNITINATDFAGNQQVANISDIYYDGTPPNNTIIRPLIFSNISGLFSVNASINDSSSGATAVNVTLFSSTGSSVLSTPMTLLSGNLISGYWNATIDSATIADGNYNISVNATDYVQNTNISANVSITIDNTKPNVSAIAPANNTVFEEIAIVMNASVNDTTSKVASVKFRLTTSDGSSISSWLTASISSGTFSVGYWNASISSTSLPNGVYNITINATDFAGNQQVINISQIQIANIAPNVTILFPSQGMNISGNLLVNASINDSGTVASVKFTLLNNTGNATLWTTMTLRIGTTSSGYWDATISTTSLIDGYYNVSVNATDNVGNVNISANISIAIDNTGANVSAVIPANGSIYDDQSFLINASVNDSVTGVFNATFRLARPGSATAWIYASMGAGSIMQGYWNATVDSSTLADGYYNITVNVTDFAGNQRMVNISSIVIDNVPPNATITSPRQDSNISAGFLVNASINESGAVVQLVNVSLLQPGSTVLGPIIMSLGSGTTTAGFWNATIDSTALPDGKYNLSVNATSSNGRTNITANVSIVIDNTQPNATIVVPLNGTNVSSSVLINASVNDSTSQVFNATFRLISSSFTGAWIFATRGSGTIAVGYWNATTSVSALNEGRYNITANVTDFAGNQRLVNISEIVVDRTAPNATIVALLNDSINGGVFVINASVNDSLSSVFNATFRLARPGSVTAWIFATMGAGTISVGYWNATFDSSTLADGYYNITINATDFAGNQRMVNISSIVIDNVPPNATITFPRQDSNISARLLVNASVNESGAVVQLVNVSFLQPGSTVLGPIPMSLGSGTTSTGFWNATIDSTALPDGIYNLSVNATSNNGRTNISANISIVIDNTLPNATIVAPANGTNSSGSILINASVNDSTSGAATALFRVISASASSSWFAASLTTGNIRFGYWSATFNTATLADGTYNITINATDFAGNSTILNISTITIDNTPATITHNSPQNNTFNNSKNITFTYTPDDLTTGLINCSLLLNGTRNTTAFGILNNQQNNFTVQNFNEGAYLWAVQCYDFAGNRNASTLNYTITIDLTVPSASITTQNGTAFATGMPNITILLNDNMMSVINYTMFVDGEADDNGTASKNVLKNSTLTLHANGTYSVLVEALDLAGNRFNSSPINITIDTVKPTINLSAPENASNIGTVTLYFNFTAYDNLADNLSCNLIIDNTINATRQAFNATSVNISVSNFTTGLHNWTVNCSDDAGNLNTSDMFFFNIIKPDLYISFDNITFNTTLFEEGRNFTITANISNIGGSQASNFLIEFYNGTPGTGNLLYSTTASLLPEESTTVSRSVVFGIGTFDIYVRLDGNSAIDELSEDNNLANRTFTVPLWNFISGNVTGDYTLENTTLSTIFKWLGAGNSTGNIFVTDYDGIIGWGNLTALGADTAGGAHMDDFEQLDTALNSTGYNDSINRTFTFESQPLSKASVMMFGRTIADVPFVNSTNNSNFVTGILWDSAGDANGEYDGTENVLFVTNISRSTQGAYGIYDYEIRVPALLRNYKLPDRQMIAFYLELK
ncbi:MAG: Ig-like domain-containing protein [Candidatus Woesearchaeota archaeon]